MTDRKHAIIIGAGIAGVATAIALTKCNGMTCSIFEIRTEPATIGGSVNLTPNAMRYLDYLGVLPRLKPKGCEVKAFEFLSLRTGKILGKIDFDNIEKFGHRSLRVMRNDLHHAMLETLEELGVKVQYGMKIQSVGEKSNSMAAGFEDGTVVEGDLLLGCDGIHSAVRMKFIEPSRVPEYSGLAVAYGELKYTEELQDAIPFLKTTSIFVGHSGLIMTFTDAEKNRLHMSAVMRAKDIGSRDGWILKGQEQETLKKDMLARFEGSTIPLYGKLLDGMKNVTLFPIRRLSGSGRWTSGRVLLLGDAAHAMPPQGESVGLAIEDTILLSRILLNRPHLSVVEAFQLYDRIRRPRIDAAVKVANLGTKTVQQRGWFMTVLIEWMTWLFLSLTVSKKEREFAYDVRYIDLDG